MVQTLFKVDNFVWRALYICLTTPAAARHWKWSSGSRCFGACWIGSFPQYPSTRSSRRSPSVLKIKTKHNSHPYKIQLVEKLNKDDLDKRLQIQRLIDDPDLLNTSFSPGCTFYLNSTVSRHNCRYRNDTNPHLFCENHTQHPQKINVICGTSGNNIAGPLLFPVN